MRAFFLCVFVHEQKWFRWINDDFWVNSGFKSHMCESGCRLSVTSVSVYSPYWASALGCFQMKGHSALLHEMCGNMLIRSVGMSHIWYTVLLPSSKVKSVLFVKPRHEILAKRQMRVKLVSTWNMTASNFFYEFWPCLTTWYGCAQLSNHKDYIVIT